MRTPYSLLLLFLIAFITTANSQPYNSLGGNQQIQGNLFVLDTLKAGRIVLGNRQSAPVASAAVDFSNTTTKGMLIPKMNTSQMLSISSPADGLFVYNTQNHNLYYYNANITTWVALGSTPDDYWNLKGNTILPDTTVWFGTADSFPIKIKTKSIERMRITTDVGNIGINNNSPEASARLDIADTQRGILVPRLTTTQMNAISNPASGLIIYNTDSLSMCVYSGSSWNCFVKGNTQTNGVTGTANRIAYFDNTGKLITDPNFKRFSSDSMLLLTAANGKIYSIEFNGNVLQLKSKSENGDYGFTTVKLDTNNVTLAYMNTSGDTTVNLEVGYSNISGNTGVTFSSTPGVGNNYSFPIGGGGAGQTLINDGGYKLNWGSVTSAIKTSSGVYFSNDTLFSGGYYTSDVTHYLDTSFAVDFQNGFGNTVRIGRGLNGGFWFLSVVDTAAILANNKVAILFANDGSFDFSANNSLVGTSSSVKLRANIFNGLIDTLAFTDMFNGASWLKYDADGVKLSAGDLDYVSYGTRLDINDNTKSIKHTFGNKYINWTTINDTLHATSNGPIFIDSLVLPGEIEKVYRANFYELSGDTTVIVNEFENTTGATFTIYHMNANTLFITCSDPTLFTDKNKLFITHTPGGDESRSSSHVLLSPGINAVQIEGTSSTGVPAAEWINYPSYIEIRKYP